MKKLPFASTVLYFLAMLFFNGCTNNNQLGVDAPVEKFSGKDLPSKERTQCPLSKCSSGLTKKEADEQGIRCDEAECTP